MGVLGLGGRCGFMFFVWAMGRCGAVVCGAGSGWGLGVRCVRLGVWRCKVFDLAVKGVAVTDDFVEVFVSVALNGGNEGIAGCGFGHSKLRESGVEVGVGVGSQCPDGDDVIVDFVPFSREGCCDRAVVFGFFSDFFGPFGVRAVSNFNDIYGLGLCEVGVSVAGMCGKRTMSGQFRFVPSEWSWDGLGMRASGMVGLSGGALVIGSFPALINVKALPLGACWRAWWTLWVALLCLAVRRSSVWWQWRRMCAQLSKCGGKAPGVRGVGRGCVWVQ